MRSEINFTHGGSTVKMAGAMSTATAIVDDSMRSYYERRAREYDDWWLGTGCFAARERPGWEEEVAELIELISSLPSQRTLDVACGTGFLTQHLAGEVTGVDQSQTMVDLAAERCPDGKFSRAEAAPLPFEQGSFDLVFASHFYGHLLPGERSPFLAEARRVGNRLVIVDAARRPDVRAEQWQRRQLSDGSVHRVFKRYFTAAELAHETGGRSILHEGYWFVAVSGDGASRQGTAGALS
jgi:ubiquinone/menaquinone biosynthesis C-methylase UbiE